MTELFIDKQRVVLPENFKIAITEENPFFTKNGQYTYDVKLSLDSTINAKIYKHYNRLNNTADLIKKRSAVLIIDNIVWLNGTEVILEINAAEVSIQLVSCNSELNYLIGGDLKVRTLNLGSAVITAASIITNLDKPYPDNDWLLIPFANNDNEFIGNEYYSINSNWYKVNNNTTLVVGPLAYAYDGVHTFKNSSDKTVKYTNYRPQPYLCFILKQILTSLGYTIGTNMIDSHDVFKFYYIVHGYDTLKFAEMLPDWTVKDFFQEIEKTFDCTVIIREDKTVDILFNHHYLTVATQKKLNVFDVFTCEINSENKLSHQNVNIGYSLDGDEYYKYNKIEDSIKKAATVEQLNDLAPELDLLSKVQDTSDINRFNKLFEANPDSEYGFNDSKYIAINDGTLDLPKNVDSFCNLMNNPENNESIDIELNIIPASMKSVEKTITVFDTQNYSMSYKLYWQYPIAEYADPFFFEDESSENIFTIQGLITGADSITEKKMTSKLRLAIYNGRKTSTPHSFAQTGGGSLGTVTIESFNYGQSDIIFPFGFVESLADYFKDASTLSYFFQDKNPFRLSWMNENIYSLTKEINTEKTYKFNFCDSSRWDIKSIFLINYREYLCAKLERSFTSDGMYPVITGYFYPLT